jgi:surface antigen
MANKLICVSVMLVMLSGCTNEAGKLNKKNVGIGAGALGGALLGSTLGKGEGKILAMVAGAAIGGIAGGSIGSYMDKADLEEMKRAEQKALEDVNDGSSLPWKGENSSGTVTILKTDRSADRSTYCREYQSNVTIGGEVKKAYGTACRKPDGSWEIQN